MSALSMVPFIAPCLGPTIGGFVAEARGWRWTFWVIAIIAAPLQAFFGVLSRDIPGAHFAKEGAQTSQSNRKRRIKTPVRAGYTPFSTATRIRPAATQYAALQASCVAGWCMRRGRDESGIRHCNVDKRHLRVCSRF